MFFWSQASASGSVGTGRLASAVFMGEMLEWQSEKRFSKGHVLRWQSERRLASCLWSCLCGLWFVAEVMLATIECTHDVTQSRFVCPAEVSPFSESAKARAVGLMA